MENGLNHVQYIERRSKPRVYIPFPATVEGIDVNGDKFKVNTVLDNLDYGCLYLRIMPCLETGAPVSVVFWLSTAATDAAISPHVIVEGEVLRSDVKPGGACGIAVAFKRKRII